MKPDIGMTHNAEYVRVPRQLLEALIDDGPCIYDHHGGCQAHGFLSLEPGELCPHEKAKWLLEGVRIDGNVCGDQVP